MCVSVCINDVYVRVHARACVCMCVSVWECVCASMDLGPHGVFFLCVIQNIFLKLHVNCRKASASQNKQLGYTSLKQPP
jgi:hypothetical protein